MPFVASTFTAGTTRSTTHTVTLPANRADGTTAWVPSGRDAIFLVLALEGVRTVTDTDVIAAGFLPLGGPVSTSSSVTIVCWHKPVAVAADVNRTLTVTGSATGCWSFAAVVVPDFEALDDARPFRSASWVTAYWSTLTATEQTPLRLLALGGARGPDNAAGVGTGPQVTYGQPASTLTTYSDGYRQVCTAIADRRQVAALAAMSPVVHTQAVPEASSTLTLSDGQPGALTVGLHLAYRATAPTPPPPPPPTAVTPSGLHVPNGSGGYTRLALYDGADPAWQTNWPTTTP